MTIIAVVQFVLVVWLYIPSIPGPPRVIQRQPARDAKECSELATAVLEAGPPGYKGEQIPHQYGAACVKETTFIRQEPA